MLVAGRAEEAGIAEGEDAAIAADHPVAAPVGSHRGADQHPVQRHAVGPTPGHEAALRCHRAQPGDRCVPEVVGAGHEADHVSPNGIAMLLATVADPLPVPRLEAGAATRLGPARVVPAEVGGGRLQVVVAGRTEAAAAETEVSGLAPTVHRGAL